MSTKMTDVKFDYGEESDVLFINLGSNEPSYSQEVDDVLLVEKGMFTHWITGFRVLGFKHHNVAFLIVLDEIKKVVEKETRAMERQFRNKRKQLPALPNAIKRRLKQAESEGILSGA